MDKNIFDIRAIKLPSPAATLSAQNNYLRASAESILSKLVSTDPGVAEALGVSMKYLRWAYSFTDIGHRGMPVDGNDENVLVGASWKFVASECPSEISDQWELKLASDVREAFQVPDDELCFESLVHSRSMLDSFWTRPEYVLFDPNWYVRSDSGHPWELSKQDSFPRPSIIKWDGQTDLASHISTRFNCIRQHSDGSRQLFLGFNEPMLLQVQLGPGTDGFAHAGIDKIRNVLVEGQKLIDGEFVLFKRFYTLVAVVAHRRTKQSYDELSLFDEHGEPFPARYTEDLSAFKPGTTYTLLFAKTNRTPATKPHGHARPKVLPAWVDDVDDGAHEIPWDKDGPTIRVRRV